MPVPVMERMLFPMLRLIGEGKEHINDCLPLLAQEFALTVEDTELLVPSGRQTVLSNRAHWARNYLSQARLVEAHARGRYHLTEAGRALLASNPATVTPETLKHYPSFVEFLNRHKTRLGEGPATGRPEVPKLGEETPEDLMERAHLQADAALVTELLEAILTMTPTRFEQLIVDLLVKMGYGGGDPAMGERLGRSGDGGIDGIINEDALGLDAVYVQAKRYAPENRIGRPALQAFVGSLTGEGATKGVFVTTSDFSREARDYLNRVQQRIVLINGDRLARLLIQHEVGVRARKTYVLRSVDEDYFAET